MPFHDSAPQSRALCGSRVAEALLSRRREGGATPPAGDRRGPRRVENLIIILFNQRTQRLSRGRGECYTMRLVPSLIQSHQDVRDREQFVAWAQKRSVTPWRIRTG